jgi:hypothetical protein
MKRNQILAITLCSLACLGYPNRSAKAAWFGPSNYEECVLEKMKGQSSYMLATAQNACRLKFPPEPRETTEVPLDKRQIQFNWCIDAQTIKQICIVDKPNNYEIRKVVLSVSAKNPCIKLLAPSFPMNMFDYFGNITSEYIQYQALNKQYLEDINNWISVSCEKSYFSATYTFKIPPGGYNCSDVSFYGFIK